MSGPVSFTPSAPRGASARPHRARTLRLGLASLTCLALLSLPSVAQAGTSGAEEITFQEGLVPDEGAIADQYQATYGVEFGSSSSLGFPGARPTTGNVGPPC